MPDEGPVETKSTRDGTSVDSRATAQNLVGNILDKQTGGSPSPEPPKPIDTKSGPPADVDGPDDDSQPEDLTEGGEVQEEAEGGQPEPQEPQTQEAIDEITDEVYMELQSYGIDLGVPPSEVAPELKDSYNQMAQTVIQVAAESRAEQLEAQQRQMQMQDFMERLEQDPTDIMMLVALNKPEQFQEAIDTYERIQGDPREKEILERELRLRAQEQATQRRQMLQQRAERQKKANRVKSQLKTACNRYGVNPQIAERLVAAEIRNKGDISATEINQIVSQLRPQGTVSPQKQKQVNQTPNRETGGAAPSGDSPKGKDTSPGLERAEVTSLRGTVKDAIKRHR